MSTSGMLGLLEGVGNGMQTMGNAFTVNALREAEARREENLMRFRQKTAREESDRIYERTRADHLADQETANARADELYARNRTDQLADQAADRQWQMDNKAPSAFAEKTAYFDRLLQNGQITEAEYKQALIGGGTGSMNGFTPKDRLKIISDLRSGYAESMQMVPEDKRASFEEWAASTQPEAWAAIGGQTSQQGMGQAGGEVRQGQIDAMFKVLLKKDPATWDAEIAQLKERGYPEQADILRSMLQKERNALNASEKEFHQEDRARTLSRKDRNYFQGTYGGLLEGHSTLR